MFGLMLASELRSLWSRLTAPKAQDKDAKSSSEDGSDDNHNDGGDGHLRE